MKLKQFRVRSFRSVEDSGWIEVDDVGALIGINESGKSNLLAPLWKLNPAKDGAIHPLSDYPRSLYNKVRTLTKKPEFIEAYFELSTNLVSKISSLTQFPEGDVKIASVARDFSGAHRVSFPNVSPIRSVPKSEVIDLFSTAKTQIESLNTATKAEELLKPLIVTMVNSCISKLTDADNEIDGSILTRLKVNLESVDTESGGQRSTIVPRLGQILDAVVEMQERISRPFPDANEDVKKLVLAHLPKFVYYSNYGNLDSEIYLPHVIDNMERKDLGSKESAKARTLKVLFDFVRLQPMEIMQLGQEAQNSTPDQLEKIAEKKRERDVLLQSAATALTKEFREWWKQGDYRFRFAADGNHFRILVSDDKRPEEIELESRSTGLQWFLSFFLVFLVEAKDSHADAILLLDEPGLTLHPLAQKDLADFFDNLAKDNQLIFSTHSPFMVESDRLDRVRAVYTNEKGQTAVSSDLRAAAAKSVQARSIYAAHAALGLSVSDVILQGCQPVVVEGPSDQHYMSTLKTYLIGKGLITPGREIVFVPGGGTRAIKAVASILASKEEELPFVILDSDGPGKELAKSLKTSLYAGQKDRIMLVGELLKRDNTEIEDLYPTGIIAEAFSRDYHGREEDFVDVYDDTRPIVQQMEAFVVKHNLKLEQGWKVVLARAVKRRVQMNPALLEQARSHLPIWKKLFEAISGAPDLTPFIGTAAYPISEVVDSIEIV